MTIRTHEDDTLIVVDVQRDFLPGGSLAVDDGNAVVPVLNRYIALARRTGMRIVASRDWHPPYHCSFKPSGGPWPAHCVAGTEGAAFAPALELPADVIIISKAIRSDADAYSAFEDTQLAEKLRAIGTKRVLVGGLATDYCVLNTVLDALRAGFQVLLLIDAIRAVNVHPGDGDRAEREMMAAGARSVCLKDFAQ